RKRGTPSKRLIQTPFLVFCDGWIVAVVAVGKLKILSEVKRIFCFFDPPRRGFKGKLNKKADALRGGLVFFEDPRGPLLHHSPNVLPLRTTPMHGELLLRFGILDTPALRFSQRPLQTAIMRTAMLLLSMSVLCL